MLSQIILAAVAVTPAMAFCGGHTHLDTRAEGEVEIKTFGYHGAIVSFSCFFLSSTAVINTQVQ